MLGILSTASFMLSTIIMPLGIAFVIFKSTRFAGKICILISALLFIATIALMVPEELQARREGFLGVSDKSDAADAGIRDVEAWRRIKGRTSE